MRNFFKAADILEAESQKYIANTEYELLSKIKESNDINKDLDLFIQQYPIEIIIDKNDKHIYQTLNLVADKNYFGSLDSRLIGVEGQGYVESQNGPVYVWYAIYHMRMDQQIISLFTNQTVLMTLGLFMLLLVVLLIHIIFLRPILKLKKAIEVVSDFNFDDIDQADDRLNQEFNEFAFQLKEIMGVVSKKQVQLEQALYTEKERLQNVLVVSKAYVHDLKSPVHQILLENEMMLHERERDSKQIESLMQKNIKKTDEVLKELNQLLLMMKDDRTFFQNAISEFDIVKIIDTSFRLFSNTIKNKQLSVNLESDEQLVVCMDSSIVKLILHNVIGNAVQYTPSKTEVELLVEEHDKSVIISIKNQCSYDDYLVMEKGRTMFSDIKNQQNNYSSGQGLFLTQDLTKLLQGSFTIHYENKAVVVTVALPIGEDR